MAKPEILMETLLMKTNRQAGHELVKHPHNLLCTSFHLHGIQSEVEYDIHRLLACS